MATNTSTKPSFWSGNRTWIIIAGIFLFLSPLALALVGLARAEKRPKWRGRVGEMPAPPGSPAARWRPPVWGWRPRWGGWRDPRR